MRFIVALALVSICSAATNDAAAETVFPDIRPILDRKELVVAIAARDMPPLVMTGQKGDLTGFDIDLARRIGKSLGVNVVFRRPGRSQEDVIRFLSRGGADIAVSNLTRSVDRAQLVYFTRPYLMQVPVILISRLKWAELRQQHPSLTDPEDLRTLFVTVASLQGSVYIPEIRRRMPNIRVKGLGSIAEMVAAIKNRDVDPGVYGEIDVKYYLRRNPRELLSVSVHETTRVKDEVAIAVRPDAPNLLRVIDTFLSMNQKVLTADELIDEYMASRSALP